MVSVCQIGSSCLLAFQVTRGQSIPIGQLRDELVQLLHCLTRVWRQHAVLVTPVVVISEGARWAHALARLKSAFNDHLLLVTGLPAKSRVIPFLIGRGIF